MSLGKIDPQVEIKKAGKAFKELETQLSDDDPMNMVIPLAELHLALYNLGAFKEVDYENH